MPSWGQRIDEWQRGLEKDRGEDPEGTEALSRKALTEWLEDASVIAKVDLQSTYLCELFQVAIIKLAEGEYGTPHWNLDLKLAAGRNVDLYEAWELDYVHGKLGPRPRI